MSQLDIDGNRSRRKYSRSELMRRLLWSFALPLFRLSPRPMHSWRRFLLRLFGAKIGMGVNIYSSATIYMPWNLEIGPNSSIGEHAYIYNLGKITIGSSSTVSQRAHLCAGTHDYNDPTLLLLKPPITIGDEVWICADAFVGPNVKVGNGAVVGARAVVTADIAEYAIVAGNPAKFLKARKISEI